MAGPMELGECPYCHERKPVTKAGVMRSHTNPVHKCQGSGHPPVGAPAKPGPLMKRAGFGDGGAT